MNRLVHFGRYMAAILFAGYLVLPSLWRTTSEVSHAESGSFMQTTQSDFKSGALDSSLDADTSPGDVKLKPSNHTAVQTTENDFYGGDTAYGGMTSSVASTGGGAVTLASHRSVIDMNSNPSIGSTVVTSILPNHALNITFIATWGDGVTVLDNKGTGTFSDDTLLGKYSSSSSIAVGDNVDSVQIDPEFGYLYVSTQTGLYVINLHGTASVSDDTLVGSYTTSSTPALQGNDIKLLTFDASRHLIFVPTFNQGFQIVNTQGTSSIADDTISATYSTSTTPAVTSGNVNQILYDTGRNLMYVASFGGLDVFSTNGTLSASDDTKLYSYNGSSTPSIFDNNAVRMTFGDTNTVIYVGTEEGVVGINTQGTQSSADDTVFLHYNNASAINVHGYCRFIAYNQTQKKLYFIARHQGAFVIDTKGTATQEDDVLANKYDEHSNPLGYGGWSSNFYIGYDTTFGAVYVGGRGAVEYNPSNPIESTGGFYSKPIDIQAGAYQSVSWDTSANSQQSVSIQTRAGTDNSYWIDDFNGNANTSYAYDAYDWGNYWQTATQANGTVKLSNFNVPYGGNLYFWFDTGKPDGYFPAGSVVNARVKLHSPGRTGSCQSCVDFIYSDDWWEDGSTKLVSDVWTTMSFTVTSHPFSKIGFNLESNDNSEWNNATDYFEIDWISVQLPSNQWGSWSSTYTNNSISAVATDQTSKKWLQYRAIFTNADSSSAPSLKSVTFARGYPTSGTLISAALDSGKSSTNWGTLTGSTVSPAGTSVQFYTRSGNSADTASGWTNWVEVQSGSNVSSPSSRYIQYKAVLSTDDETVTPTLSSVSISYETSEPTSVPTSIPTATVKPTAAPKSIINGSTPSIVLSPSVTPTQTESEPLVNELTPTGVPTTTVSEPMGNDSTPSIVKVLKIVLKDKNGKPLAFVKVTLHSTPRTATTDKDGVATFTNVEVGEHTIDYEVAGKSYSQKLAVVYDELSSKDTSGSRSEKNVKTIELVANDTNRDVNRMGWFYGLFATAIVCAGLYVVWRKTKAGNEKIA